MGLGAWKPFISTSCTLYMGSLRPRGTRAWPVGGVHGGWSWALSPRHLFCICFIVCVHSCAGCSEFHLLSVLACGLIGLNSSEQKWIWSASKGRRKIAGNWMLKKGLVDLVQKQGAVSGVCRIWAFREAAAMYVALGCPCKWRWNSPEKMKKSASLVWQTWTFAMCGMTIAWATRPILTTRRDSCGDLHLVASLWWLAAWLCPTGRTISFSSSSSATQRRFLHHIPTCLWGLFLYHMEICKGYIFCNYSKKKQPKRSRIPNLIAH